MVLQKLKTATIQMFGLMTMADGGVKNVNSLYIDKL